MAIPRITPQIVEQYGLVSAPDILTGTPKENKALFDRLIREKIADCVNQVLDAWDEYTLFEAYQPGKTYNPYNKVSYMGSTYQCLRACTGQTPDQNPLDWHLLAERGRDGDGAGDMVKAVYDPQNHNEDIFRYADSLTVKGGLTGGTASSLTLSAPAGPLEGQMLRFKLHTAVTLPAKLSVNNTTAFPLTAPFRGSTAFPAGTRLGAVFTGGVYAICEDASQGYADKTILWQSLAASIGTWSIPMKYTKVNGIVYLTGLGYLPANTGVFATLPAGFRPGTDIPVLSRAQLSQPMDPMSDYIVIRTDGTLNSDIPNINTTPNRICLSIAFPAEK